MKLDDMTLQTPYLNLNEEFYDITIATPLENPYLISYNCNAAKLINLELDINKNKQLVDLLNCNYTLKGAKSFSMCYAGHQFGQYAPRLGDGRVINLGKISNWNLQLKGSGETLYSRTADGRASMASSIREYLISESMYHLGIPTTRALAIIGSKTKIIRNSIENASIVMRMSTSWVRFGTFEYFYYTKQYDKVKELALYVINESYPNLKNDEDCYYKMFCEILHKTAILIAKWQSVGFCHGVINTDNMSIEGLGIDYGPFSMLDDFKANYVCNLKDKAGRYAYNEQANVAYWNLTKLSKALSPLISKQRMQKKLDEYGEFYYFDVFVEIMRKKLGLQMSYESDMDLIRELYDTLEEIIVDYTLFFRTLCRYDGNKDILLDIAMNPVALDIWLDVYDLRLQKETLCQEKRQKNMLEINPKYVLKNYMLEEAIQKAEKGDHSMVNDLLYIAAHPYDELTKFEHFAYDTPEQSKNVGLSCLS